MKKILLLEKILPLEKILQGTEKAVDINIWLCQKKEKLTKNCEKFVRFLNMAHERSLEYLYTPFL